MCRKTMIFMYRIISFLTAAALAKGPIECNFLESTGSRQCFGVVGQPLLFHLPNRTNTEFRLIKDNKYRILRKIKNNTVTLDEKYADSYNRSELLTSGTLNLGYAKKKHCGDYTLEEYDSNGTLLKKVNVQLEIQAQVSEPVVSQACFSQEQMKVSCSTDSDGVEFSLRLDNQILVHVTDQSQQAGNIQSLAVTIGLHHQQTGNLTCAVWNKVSRHETTIHLADCKEVMSPFPVVTVTVIAVVVTLLVLVTLCLGIKELHDKPRPATVDECNSDAHVINTDDELKTDEENQPQLAVQHDVP